MQIEPQKIYLLVEEVEAYKKEVRGAFRNIEHAEYVINMFPHMSLKTFQIEVFD